MAITYGFYNSINHDRKYYTTQISQMFDGIIEDGIFMTIGNAFVVKADEGNTVNVDTGKAWFNHTWTINDSIYPITLEDSDLLLTRIDSIVIEVDSVNRINSIKALKGTAASNPVPPELSNGPDVFQYAICNITRPPESTEITQSNIKSLIGTGETPFVTGVLKSIDINILLGQWQGELDEFIDENQQSFSNWRFEQQEAFEIWFNDLQAQLDGDIASNLQNQINKLKRLEFYNTTVPVSKFGPDEEYENYPFKATIELVGVYENMTPMVVLDINEATSGDFAPISKCYDGGVYIYSSIIPEKEIVIPTITCWGALF